MTSRRSFLIGLGSVLSLPAMPALAIAPEAALLRDQHGWITQYSTDGRNWSDARKVSSTARYVRWRRPTKEEPL